MSTSRYRWVRHGDTTLYNVGILEDGTLYNPNNYPDAVVREAVLAANARRHERRGRAAKKAAATRQQRTELHVYAIAQNLLAGGKLEPRTNCRLCGKGLSDKASIERGVGSECWQTVMSAMEHAP